MGILNTFSYLERISYKPTSFTDLENIISPSNPSGTGKILSVPIANDIHNLTLKLGFVWQGRDFISKIDSENNPDPVLANFYLNNFVYDTKSFLDSVAVTLNDIYKLGHSKGEIDLEKTRFINSVTNSSPALSQHITKNMKWIKDVTDWRLNLIHRFSIMVGNYSTMHDRKDPDGTIGGKCIPLRMPAKPIPFLEMSKFIHNNGESISVTSFVEDWLSHAKDLFENTCEDLVRFFNANKSNIIE